MCVRLCMCVWCRLIRISFDFFSILLPFFLVPYRNSQFAARLLCWAAIAAFICSALNDNCLIICRLAVFAFWPLYLMIFSILLHYALCGLFVGTAVLSLPAIGRCVRLSLSRGTLCGCEKSSAICANWLVDMVDSRWRPVCGIF